MLPEFPNQFHPEMRLGIRIALMEFVVRAINKDLMDNVGVIIDQLITQNRKLSRADALIFATQQVDRKTRPYLEFIRSFGNQMSTTLNNALELEKAGSIDGAIVLYEKLADDAFKSPMPHERLRII